MNWKYLQLAEPVKLQARIPRFGRLIALISNDPQRLKRVTNNASLFWELYSHVDDDPNSTGLIDSGLAAIEAGKLGLQSESEDNIRKLRKNTANRQWQVRLAMDCWGAIAFRMLCGKDNRGESPPLDRVDKEVDQFMQKVGELFADRNNFHDGVGPYRNHLNKPLDEKWTNNDLECLRHLNTYGLRHLVLTDDWQRIVFADISTQAFFAALWACRWATPTQLDITRNWIPDLAGDTADQYREFWQMVIDLPAEAVNQQQRETILSPLFDGSLRDKLDRPIRSTELICLSFKLMKDAPAGQAFLQEFQELLSGTKGLERRAIAEELLWDVGGKFGTTGASHFLTLCEGRGPQSENGRADDGTFEMGATDNEEEYFDEFPRHRVTLSPYRLHRFCVTNAKYELFDPRHGDLRAFTDKVKNPAQLVGHPVVNVSWWDAAAFALFLGELEIDVAGKKKKYEIRLPTEAQWEYACRCGQSTPFTWGIGPDGRQRDGNKIESGYCNFDGNYPWAAPGSGETNEGPDLK